MSGPLPIGIFDSGIGGLTVLAALQRQLPGEEFLYLGDTARLPYGTKSSETVVRYALRAGRFLVGEGIRLLVVACNTASAAALPVVEEALTVPVIGVVSPGARAAAAHAAGCVGVIGTESTIASGAYPRALASLRPDLTTITRACPLFVPLAEEGWFDHPITHAVARIYLEPLREAGVDTVVLGCTHYPLLRPAITAALGETVALIDSADAVAGEVATLLGVTAPEAAPRPRPRILVTDAAARFLRIARLILGDGVETLELIDLPD